MTAIRVSDHALIRFLERSGSLDLEALRAGIEASLARAHEAAASIAACQYLITVDELTYVVRGDTVVTVLDRGSRRHRALAATGPGRAPRP